MSVMIATLNRPDDVARAVRSARAQSWERIEVVVVDDGSDPPIEPEGVDHLLRNDRNLGICGARNAGIRAARGSLVVQLDDDAVFASPSEIERAVALANAYPAAAAIGFRQLTPDGAVHYMQPAAGDELSRASRFFGQGVLFRREALEASGLYCEDIRHGYEEIELSLRLIDAGWEILYAPALQVVHHEATAGRDWRRMRRFILLNSWMTTLLRYPWWTIPAALVVHTRRFIRLARHNGDPIVGSMGWAAGELLRQMPALIRQRKPVRFETLRITRRLTRGVAISHASAC